MAIWNRYIDWRPFARPVLVAALACAGCSTGTTDPDRDLTSDWAATVVVASNQWRIDMSLTQIGDSLTGSARVVAAPSGFSEGYRVWGRVAGDSVRLALQPVEDATVNVRGIKQRGDMIGVMWFNVDSLNARPVTFVRSPQKL